MIPRHRALSLLTECTGETIWPVEHCQHRGVPAAWIDELADAFESNPSLDRDAIYFEETMTNQFHGVRDVDLAMKLGQALGIDVDRLESVAVSRSRLVQAIKEAIMEG